MTLGEPCHEGLFRFAAKQTARWGFPSEGVCMLAISRKSFDFKPKAGARRPVNAEEATLIRAIIHSPAPMYSPGGGLSGVHPSLSLQPVGGDCASSAVPAVID
jgi:hypothetical protein